MITMETSTDTIRRLTASMRAADFGSPFVIHPLGSFTDASGTLYAPDVWHDDATDVQVDDPGWEALTGFTGQYGYHGAVMHASETFGPRMVEAMWEYARESGNGETFVIVSVDVLPTDDEPDPEPAGWAILHYVGAH